MKKLSQSTITNYPASTHKIPLSLIRKFEPKSIWLLHESTIHDIDHMARVFMLQELICEKLEKQGIEVNREAVRWAAITHDMGRIDDGIDVEHGQRSAKWIKDNLSDQMSPEILDIVAYIVHWHVPSDKEAPVMTTELKALKDADGLDRVRLGDLDPSFLRTAAALELLDTAHMLYEESLATQGDQDESKFESVVNAATRIGLALDI